MEADFSGWATKANVKCSDGRTIMPGAFKHQDKQKVPLVWSHQHSDPSNVLGHAILEDRAFGTYVYGFFNNTQKAKDAKAAVQHQDYDSLSIYANQLVEQGDNVMHGSIKEVSLVLAGANPEAVIENVYIRHGEDLDELDGEAVIRMGLHLEHSQQKEVVMTPKAGTKGGSIASRRLSELFHEEDENNDPTVGEVYESMNEDQKLLFHVAVAEASGDVEHGDLDEDDDDDDDDDTDDDTLEHDGVRTLTRKKGKTKVNVFDQDGTKKGDVKTGAVLTHAQILTILDEAKTVYGGSYKKSFLAHVDEYGITNIDVLFPDATTVDNTPDFVKRRTEWVGRVLGGTKHLPYSRVRTRTADITLDTARAKGYVKGTMKKEEFFAITQRSTTPTTIYKKQKLDRDDMIDITDFDVAAFLKGEMRLMWEEEVARAILIGDGREVDDEDKVKEPASNADGAGIRSIAYDADFYSIKTVLATNVSAADAGEAIIRSLDDYEGLGGPTMFALRGFVTDLLLQKDKMGRRLYRTRAELADELGVAEIIDVPVFADAPLILSIIVNLQDYSVGTDKGGELSFFDDFDIDYNQFKYLYEGRMSGALTKWRSAIVISRAAGTLVTPNAPTFVSSTGVVTIVATTGVVYKNADTDVVLSTGAQSAIDPGESIEVVAVPATGYYFPHNFDADWEFIADPE